MESTNPMPKFDTQHVKEVSVVNKEPKTKKMASSVDAKIKVTGKYSGRNYLFDRAGSTQDVDEIDVEWMLSLRQGGRQCCGGSEAGNRIFVLA